MSPLPTPRSPSIGKYYLYQATSTVGFITPVFVLFLLARELSFAQIAALSAINWVTVTLGEVPTGYLGDRIGRRNSLLASTTLMALSMLGFVVADSFPSFVILYVLWGIGMTFTSGSESAWLYETLKSDLAEGEFTRIRGRGGSIKRWVGAVTMTVGGFLYVADHTLPFLVGTAWHILGVPILLTMSHNPGYGTEDPGNTGGGEEVSAEREGPGPIGSIEALGLVRNALLEPPLRSFVLYVGLLFAAVGAANTYVQPITVDVFETHLRAIETLLPVPPEATLGVMYAGFQAVSAVASYYAGEVEAVLGVRDSVRFGVPLVGVALVVPLAVPVLAIPVFFAMRAASTVAQPIASRHLNDRIASAGRATVLSAASMAYAILRIPLILAGGIAADVLGPLVAVAGFGTVVLVAAAAIAVVEPPLDDGETEDVATNVN